MMKDIKEYEGLYAVSDEGRVWSYRNNRFLGVYVDSRGYPLVKLCKDGSQKNFRVHRLVLETFEPKVNMKDLQVNHINEDKTDNRLENLEWTTSKENTLHSRHKLKGTRGKRRRVEQYTLEGKYIATYPSQAEAARQTDINRYCISDVLRGRNHTAGGFIWRFEDEGE